MLAIINYLEGKELSNFIATIILISVIFVYIIYEPLRNSNIYSPIIFILIIISILYLVLKNNIKKSSIKIEYITKPSKTLFLILNIIFLSLFISSIFLIFNAINYTRPLLYFIIITFAIAFLVYEILIYPNKKKYNYLNLLKIILIGINIRLGIQFLFFNSFIWYDPWYHASLSEIIFNTGFVPENFAYSDLPVFHIYLTILQLFSGLHTILLNYINIILKTSLTSFFFFLIGIKILKNEKIGLLSALLYVILDRSIIYDVSFSPTSFAIILVIYTIYLLLKKELNDQLGYSVLILLLISTLIFSHALTPVTLIVILLSAFLIFKAVEKISSKKSIPIMGLIILTSVSTLSYWMYTTGYFIDQLANIIGWGFNVEKVSPYMSFGAVSDYLSNISIIEHFLSYLGFYLFVSLSYFGFLVSLCKKNKYLIFFSVAGGVMLIFTFFGIFLKLYTIPDRWWYYSQHILTIITVIGIISISKAFSDLKENLKKSYPFLIIIFFVLISFFNLTSPVANIDSSLYSDNLTVRRASTQSEIYSVQTFQNIHNGAVLIDVQHIHPYKYSFKDVDPNDINIIDESFLNDYSDFKGLIILRKYILDGNPFDSQGIHKLRNNSKIEIEQNLDRIYDSYTVIGYIN